MKKVRIIASAGAWGYGPCSTLIMLLNKMNEFACVDFVGNAVSLDFALKHQILFHKIYQSMDEIGINYDIAISIMEPELLIWSKVNQIRSICVDNLYWMWDWNQECVEFVEDISQKISADKTIGDIQTILGTKGHYSDYATMYTIPEKIYLQRFYNGIPEQLQRFDSKIQFIEPIVDLRFKKDFNSKKNKVLISFSGMKNPYVDHLDLIIYLFLINKIFNKVIKRYGERLEFVFAVPETLIQEAKRILHNHRVYCLKHSEILSIMNEALLVFAPAGMATIYECLAYEVPLIILPEQHDGNYANYDGLCQSSNEKEGCKFKECFPEIMLSTRIVEGKSFKIEEFYDFYLEEIMKDNSILLKEWENVVERHIYLANNSLDTSLLARKQKNIVSNIVGQFGGVDEIIDSIKLLCEVE